MAHVHQASANIDLLGFIVLGLLGSFAHCAVMCAPFVLFVSRRYAPTGDRREAVVAQLWYSSGRIATYAILGAAAGAFGGAIELGGAWLGVQRAAAFAAGAVLIATAVLSLTDQSLRLQS